MTFDARKRPAPFIGRTDANQKGVIDALRNDGFEVRITSGMGKGWPDAEASFWMKGLGPYAIKLEIKDGNKPPSARRLTPDQLAFARKYRGPYAVVHSAQEARWLCGQLRAGNIAALMAPPFRDRLPPERRSPVDGDPGHGPGALPLD